MSRVFSSFLIFLIFLFISISCSSTNAGENIKKLSKGIKYTASPEEEAFLDSLQYKTFLYFMNEVNPSNGLVKDRSTNGSPSSIAAVGFALPVWTIGIEHNWIERKKGVQLTLNLLKFLMNSEQSTASDATGYNGFYYHFLDMETGKRYRDCELSSIDTAWLLAGIRFARMYYDRENDDEKAIRNLADSVSFRMNWDWWVKPDSVKDFGGAVTMGWDPKNGFGGMSWIGYNEGHYLYVLGAGTGYEGFQKGYDTWIDYYDWYEPYPNLAHACFPALFAFQWSQCFIDYRGIYDDYMMNKKIDYFENSRRATLTHQQYAIENPKNWIGYDSLTWGLTACDGPLDDISSLDRNVYRGYSERGVSYPFRDAWDDGTIAPTGAAASIVFAPEVVIPTLLHMYKKYGNKGLWGEYGFKDAFNPTLDWIDTDYLGIDQGPIVIMIENLRNGFVWEYSMRDPVIKEGLEKLGFRQK